MTTVIPPLPKSAPHIRPLPTLDQMSEELTRAGYLVVPPSEVRSAKADGLTLHSHHHAILLVLLRRMVAGKRDAPDDLARQGLTNPEISRLLGHESLHRRVAELRSCGLITRNLEGAVIHRGRAAVNAITSAGVAVVREMSKGGA